VKEILLDANIVLRLVQPTDQTQQEQAEHLLASARRRRQPLVLLNVTIAEIVFVLGKFYEVPRSAVADILRTFALDSSIKVEDRRVLLAALDLYADSNVHFPDALLAATAAHRGQAVASFDRDFRKFLEVDWVNPAVA
jgi:predicted nucleic acid-binding protein